MTRRWTPWALALALLVGPAAAQSGRTLDVEAGADSAATPPVERTGGRVALVLGNARYDGVAPLVNAVNDAQDMAAALQRLGFAVITETDHGRDQARAAIERFEQAARGADVALAFYAGHGVEVGGQNYLIPVDFRPAAAAPDEQAIALREVLAAMSGAALQVVVLDACRNAAFEGGGGGGWAPPPAAGGGTLVAYGTAPGDVASDNPGGRNGLFTSALLAELRVPGLEAAELMRRVTRRVREESRALHAAVGRPAPPQSPWLSASYVLPFYFVEPEGGEGQPEVEAPAADVERWYQAGRAAYDREDYAAAEPDLRRAARAGHTESQYYLATMYLAGRGLPEDSEAAADWFRLASLRGHAKAQYFLGGMYSGGFGGVRRDDRQAAELYQRAAEQGLAAAQFRLGVIYEVGRGVRRDGDEAVRWYLLAAEQGHREARQALDRLAGDGDAAARSALRLL